VSYSTDADQDALVVAAQWWRYSWYMLAPPEKRRAVTRARQARHRARRRNGAEGVVVGHPEGRARIAAFRDGLQRLGRNAVAVTRANSAGIVGDGGTW